MSKNKNSKDQPSATPPGTPPAGYLPTAPRVTLREAQSGQIKLARASVTKRAK